MSGERVAGYGRGLGGTLRRRRWMGSGVELNEGPKSGVKGCDRDGLPRGRGSDSGEGVV